MAFIVLFKNHVHLTWVKTVNGLNKIAIKTFYGHENLERTFECNSARKKNGNCKFFSEFKLTLVFLLVSCPLCAIAASFDVLIRLFSYKSL